MGGGNGGQESGARSHDRRGKKGGKPARRERHLGQKSEDSKKGQNTVAYRASKPLHSYLKGLATERAASMGEVARDAAVLEKELRGRLRRMLPDLQQLAAERDLSVDRNLAELLERLAEIAFDCRRKHPQ